MDKVDPSRKDITSPVIHCFRCFQNLISNITDGENIAFILTQ